ncbi:MAG: glycosyltransferase [Candidatus Marinimicrobia bacterium]|jgi:hypothetical protein|nr:glycosyltransferase [Candidatus Neomarinimicrobiota bacterium]MBT3497110.1 glycosyltransferase [Candidatus Neomarinimicrobiota bacterium]MBT3691945.1 glycosyltransferase [Candidatus Neomarinimicrobiota bacterium]MBT3732024.1 glycosyltransferase [Candidatus Neomarinimicrobiota bacterium]MBT4144196.1 glycosyltransferase [Candidatus Neomarinimicrobiota bacterium]
MTKILYISPENTVGTLSQWKKMHEARGNQCEIVTLYPAKHQYEEGICLNLPLISTDSWYTKFRHKYYQVHRGKLGDYQEKEGFPPTWEPHSFFEKKYFKFRDWIWHFYIEPAIKEYGLMDYDIYHFEWGLGLYRDSRFAKRVAEAGKAIVCTYHGQDMRTRGVIPEMDALSQLNLTSELDLVEKHPNLDYLFLPFDTEQYNIIDTVRSPVKVCHSPTNRHYKGSEDIIPICQKLAEEGLIAFNLIENQPYEQVIKQKQESDILVDQIHNRGGWGYGMNSVESLAMGLVCMTELVEPYQTFIPDHPFIHITAETFEQSLRDLISNPALLKEKKQKSKAWVEKYHSHKSVSKVLYAYYKQKGWI